MDLNSLCYNKYKGVIKIIDLVKTIASELLKNGTFKKSYANTDDRDKHLPAINYLIEKGYCTYSAKGIDFIELEITNLGNEELKTIL